jgi:hypothetical protein
MATMVTVLVIRPGPRADELLELIKRRLRIDELELDPCIVHSRGQVRLAIEQPETEAYAAVTAAAAAASPDWKHFLHVEPPT